MPAKEHRPTRFPLFIVHICYSIVRNKPNFGKADYSACVVYNKTIIHLSVGESVILFKILFTLSLQAWGRLGFY